MKTYPQALQDNLNKARFEPFIKSLNKMADRDNQSIGVSFPATYKRMRQLEYELAKHCLAGARDGSFCGQCGRSVEQAKEIIQEYEKLVAECK